MVDVGELASEVAQRIAADHPDDIDTLLAAVEELPALVASRAARRRAKARAQREVDGHLDVVVRQLTNGPGQHYYFAPGSNAFVRCSGGGYTPAAEDEVLADVLRQLRSAHPSLRRIKHKLRPTVMRKIKDNTLLGSIPDSMSIQTVLGIMRTVLVPSKAEAKLLLTALGDGILRKSAPITYVMDPRARPALQTLREVARAHLGPRRDPCRSFQHAYTPSERESVRVFRTHEGCPEAASACQLLDRHALAIAVVCAHYSTQHGSAHALASRTCEQQGDNGTWLSACALTPDAMVAGFASRVLVPRPGATVTPDQMAYLWTADGARCGRLMSMPLAELRRRLPYERTSAGYADCWSPELASVDGVVSFVRSALEPAPGERLLELSELYTLYTRMPGAGDRPPTEEVFCDIVRHFSPALGLDLSPGRLHLDGVLCTLWDKRTEVASFLAAMPACPPSITVAYRDYVHAVAPPTLRVSRAYFALHAPDVAPG